MAWQFGYKIELVVFSDQYSYSELQRLLLPLESTPRVSVKKKPGPFAVWEKLFAHYLTREDGQDTFADELHKALEAMVPMKTRLLQISENAAVEFLIKIFAETHTVLTLTPKQFSGFSDLGLPIYIEFYGKDT